LDVKLGNNQIRPYLLKNNLKKYLKGILFFLKRKKTILFGEKQIIVSVNSYPNK